MLYNYANICCGVSAYKPERQDAGCFQSLELVRSAHQLRKVRNGMDGRQDVGCNHSLGFLLRKNPRPKNDMDVIFGQRKG
jgi:hypothetical protein